MADTAIPEYVQQLLRDHIHTYEQLEILMLLHKQPGVVWTLDGLSERLKISDSLVDEALQQLIASGLTVVEGARGGLSRYRVNAPDAQTLVDALARVYADNPMALMHLLTVNAIERMRTQAVRMFADAFLIRKKK